jgi:hypothetical protein
MSDPQYASLDTKTADILPLASLQTVTLTRVVAINKLTSTIIIRSEPFASAATYLRVYLPSGSAIPFYSGGLSPSAQVIYGDTRRVIALDEGVLISLKWSSVS